MYELSVLLFLLFASTSAVELDHRMTTEEKIMMREFAWADKEMASYKRHRGSSINAVHVHTDEWIRSSINIVHVHTKEWKNDSIDSIRTSSSRDTAEPGNLRKRNNASASAVEVDHPMTTENDIVMRELAWAVKEMSGYMRHHGGNMPLRRPSFNAVHVHTNEWKNNSIDSIRNFSSSVMAEPGNLRKRNNALGSDR